MLMVFGITVYGMYMCINIHIFGNMSSSLYVHTINNKINVLMFIDAQ